MAIPDDNEPRPRLRLARRSKPREEAHPWAAPEPKSSQTDVQQMLRDNVRRDEWARRLHGPRQQTVRTRTTAGRGNYFLLLIAGYAAGSALFWLLPHHSMQTMIIVATGMLFYTVVLTWFMWASKDDY